MGAFMVTVPPEIYKLPVITWLIIILFPDLKLMANDWRQARIAATMTNSFFMMHVLNMVIKTQKATPAFFEKAGVAGFIGYLNNS
jgi:hypothetical protein